MQSTLRHNLLHVQSTLRHSLLHVQSTFRHSLLHVQSTLRHNLLHVQSTLRHWQEKEKEDFFSVELTLSVEKVYAALLSFWFTFSECIFLMG